MLFIILQKFYTSVQASGELLQTSKQPYSNNPMHEKYTVLQITTTPFLHTTNSYQVAIILLSNTVQYMTFQQWLSVFNGEKITIKS